MKRRFIFLTALFALFVFSFGCNNPIPLEPDSYILGYTNGLNPEEPDKLYVSFNLGNIEGFNDVDLLKNSVREALFTSYLHVDNAFGQRRLQQEYETDCNIEGTQVDQLSATCAVQFRNGFFPVPVPLFVEIKGLYSYEDNLYRGSSPLLDLRMADECPIDEGSNEFNDCFLDEPAPPADPGDGPPAVDPGASDAPPAGDDGDSDGDLLTGDDDLCPDRAEVYVLATLTPADSVLDGCPDSGTDNDENAQLESSGADSQGDDSSARRVGTLSSSGCSLGGSAAANPLAFLLVGLALIPLAYKRYN